MAKKKLNLEIITQEKPLLQEEIDQVTVFTESGEVTILPGHIGLFSKLKEGLLTYRNNEQNSVVAIYGGFMDVSPDGVVTILADAADRAEDLDIAKIEAAQSKAQEVLKGKNPVPQDFAMAETALRKTYLQLKAARSRSKRSNQTQV